LLIIDNEISALSAWRYIK